MSLLSGAQGAGVGVGQAHTRGWDRQLRFSWGHCQYFETWWPPKLSHAARERPARTASPSFLRFLSQGVSILKTSIFISVSQTEKESEA